MKWWNELKRIAAAIRDGLVSLIAPGYGVEVVAGWPYSGEFIARQAVLDLARMSTDTPSATIEPPEIKTSRRASILLADIKPWPEVNPRGDLDDEETDLLGQSFDQVGQQEPIKVNRSAEKPLGEQYQLIDGRRRVLAAMRVGLSTIEADVCTALTPAEALACGGAEFLRLRFHVREEARHMTHMVQAGRSVSYIASTTGYSEDVVCKRITLVADLIPEVQRMMIRPHHPLPVHQALQVARIRDPKTQAELAGKIAPTGGPVMGEKKARELVQALKEPTPSLHQQLDETPPSRDGGSSPGVRPGAKDQTPTPPAPGPGTDPNMTGMTEVVCVWSTSATKRIGKTGGDQVDAGHPLDGGVNDAGGRRGAGESDRRERCCGGRGRCGFAIGRCPS